MRVWLALATVAACVHTAHAWPICGDRINSTCFVNTTQVLQDCTSPAACVFDGPDTTIEIAEAISLSCNSSAAACYMAFNVKGLTVAPNARLHASFLNITAGWLTVANHAVVDTSGAAPPDAPARRGLQGGGGNNGGTGGLSICNKDAAAALGVACCSTASGHILPPPGMATVNAFDPVASMPHAWGGNGGAAANVSAPRGGGQVRVVAGNVTLNGTLAADGAPAQLPFAGAGAGGTIAVTVAGFLVGTGTVSASGGAAVGNGNNLASSPAGGGGGVALVEFYGGFSLPGNTSVQVFGGQGIPHGVDSGGCTVGSAGTVVIRDLRAASTSLFVSNWRRPVTQAVTVMPIVNATADVASISVEAASIAVCVLDTSLRPQSYITLTDVTVAEAPCAQPSTFVAADISITGNSKVDIAGDVTITVDTLLVDDDAVVLVTGTAAVHATTGVAVRGHILDQANGIHPKPSGAALSVWAAATIDLTADTFINLGSVVFSAGSAVTLDGALLAISTAPAAVCSTDNATRASCGDLFAANASLPDLLHHNYTLAVSAPSISVAALASVSGNAVLLCGATVDVRGTVSANEHGCEHDRGAGAGASKEAQTVWAGSGGGHGGPGGESSTGALGGVAYGNASLPSNSGSGGGSSRPDTHDGGRGGGFIRVEATEGLQLEDCLCALGGQSIEGNAVSGGGAGGSVVIITPDLSGAEGRVLANGGPGSPDALAVGASVVGGGGGGGGRIVFQPPGYGGQAAAPITTNWQGKMAAEGGRAAGKSATGGDGSILGPLCPPGYTSLYCKPCGKGTYKSVVGPGECLPCTNKPSHAEYTIAAATSSDCDYVCKPGYRGTKCLSSVGQLLQAFGGVFGFLLTITAILLFLVGCVLWGRRLHALREKQKLKDSSTGIRHAETSLTMPLVDPPLSSGADTIRGSTRTRSRNLVANSRGRRPALRSAASANLAALKPRDLPKHAHRVYFTGCNTFADPLALTGVPHPALAPLVHAEEYKEFAAHVAALARWPRLGWEALVYALLLLACPPLAYKFYRGRQLHRVCLLRHAVLTNDHGFLSGRRAKTLQNALRFGASRDNTLAYIDVLFEERAVPAGLEVGQPRLPLTLLLAGDGRFLSPVHLDPNDVMVRAVPSTRNLHRFIDTEWIDFVAELNLRAQAVNPAHLSTLRPLLVFLEAMRRDPDQLGGLQVDLAQVWVDAVPPPPREESYQVADLDAGFLRSPSVMSPARGKSGQVPPPPRAVMASQFRLGVVVSMNAQMARGASAAVAAAAGGGGAAMLASMASPFHPPKPPPADDLSSSFEFGSNVPITVAASVAASPGGLRRRAAPDEEDTSALERFGLHDSPMTPHRFSLGPAALQPAPPTPAAAEDSEDDVSAIVVEGTGDGGTTPMLTPSGAPLRAASAACFPCIKLRWKGPVPSLSDMDGAPNAGDALQAPPRRDSFAGLDIGAASHGSLGRAEEAPNNTGVAVLGRGLSLMSLPSIEESAETHRSPTQTTIVGSTGGVVSLSASHSWLRKAWWQSTRAIIHNVIPRRSFRLGALSLYAMLTATQFVLLIVDVAMTFLILTELLCPTLGGGSSSNNSQYALGSPMQGSEACSPSWLFIWLSLVPAACVCAPLWGLLCVAYQSSMGLRLHSMWNLASLVNVMVAFGLLFTQFGADHTSSIAFPIAQLVAKLLMVVIAPQQVALIECRRPVEGWRGLSKTASALVVTPISTQSQHTLYNATDVMPRSVLESPS